MLRMLSREDMIKSSQLVVIGKACLRVSAMQILSQLQHIIGVTALRTIDVLHKVLTSLLAGEVFATTVTTKSQRTLASNNLPKVRTCGMISLIATQFCYTLKTNHLGHLSVGMHIIQTIATLHQRVEQSAM